MLVALSEHGIVSLEGLGPPSGDGTADHINLVNQRAVTQLLQRPFQTGRQHGQSPEDQTRGWQAQSSTASTPEQQSQASDSATSSLAPVTPQQTLPTSLFNQPRFASDDNSGNLLVQRSCNSVIPGSSAQEQAGNLDAHQTEAAPLQDAEPFEDAGYFQDAQVLPTWLFDLPQSPSDDNSGHLLVQESYSNLSPESSIQGQAEDLGTYQTQATAPLQDAEPSQDAESSQDAQPLRFSLQLELTINVNPGYVPVQESRSDSIPEPSVQGQADL
ncbi:hypothetical protein LX32DRAFT_196528 [Colletotrichum zoysiae]|uniref:Uncharacterized protein n=1 Tax=Colletotrichum zoysiae TaxID=1216348 RepID=A0AAD9HQI3_9PEZI|nr:hypothetical protein LX32DRAFT_196528 [Colletotrichum zoysiae]